MTEPTPDELEVRVLLLPPTRRDGEAAVPLFRAAGIALALCRDVGEICAEAARGAGVAILPDEAIRADAEGCLARLLAEQPPWSDFPLIVLTAPNLSASAARDLESIGHMTLVSRPIEIRSLISAVQAALRDRRRQYARRADFAERERQAQALRENDRHKDEFLAMLAHELRNPLAAVNNAVTVLKMSADGEGRDWAADVVARQVRQLVRLIDDLLDVSRITSGKIRLRKEYFDAGPVLDQAIEAARPLIDERRHTLHVSIDRGGLPLYADATRVGQIASNLLMNAAKYTEAGGRIWLEARREGEQVVVSVRDDGMGIPPEQLPEMFRLFAQGDRSLARSEGGLGIGLTVVQRLAEMHGGVIEARSAGPGLGSEFVVRLPLARPPDGESAGPPASRHEARPGSRVLIVDDNVDIAVGMARLLKLIGLQAVAVHDGPSALEAARELRPDFVLLDIGLPGMDGYRVASALRADDALGETVIIAVSGYGQEEDRRKSRAAGFDHHLVKPLDFDELLPLLGAP